MKKSGHPHQDSLHEFPLAGCLRADTGSGTGNYRYLAFQTVDHSVIGIEL